MAVTDGLARHERERTRSAACARTPLQTSSSRAKSPSPCSHRPSSRRRRRSSPSASTPPRPSHSRPRSDGRGKEKNGALPPQLQNPHPSAPRPLMSSVIFNLLLDPPTSLSPVSSQDLNFFSKCIVNRHLNLTSSMLLQQSETRAQTPLQLPGPRAGSASGIAVSTG